MAEHDDEALRQRLRAIAPEVPAAPARWIEPLLEDAVSTAPTTETTTDQSRLSRAPRWAAGLAAAALVAAAAAGGATLLRDDMAPSTSKAEPDLVLTAPGGDAIGSCLMFDVAILQEVSEVAFAGTATEVLDGRVRVEVDRAYHGQVAEGDIVMMDAPNHSAMGVTFEEGKRYLVSAADGTVVGCGYTGEHSDELAAAYAEAFAR